MQPTPSRACKFILTTYESSVDGNQYYDTTFHLRVPFQPNARGVYKVQVNEALFKNNEATLSKADWIRYTITKSDDSQTTVTVAMKQDWYTYASTGGEMYEQFYKIMTGKSSAGTSDTTYTTVSGAPAGWDIKLFDPLGGAEWKAAKYEDDTVIAYNPLPTQLRLQIKANDIKSVTMEYSSNFTYLLNNLNLKLDGVYQAPNTFHIDFYNIRFCGAYLYILETPIRSVVSTYNAMNQPYNIVAMCYNTSSYHNSIQQCISSMECTANDLSNLQFRLLNDQWEGVRIHDPVYIQITVSNDE